MFRLSNLLYLFLCLAFLQSCNTLLNVSTINFEIVVPGKIKIPPEYQKAAIRYNNCNVSVNPNFNFYMEDNEKFENKINIDSIASEVYYQIFISHLKNQQFFDTIIELEPVDFSNIVLNDSLVYSQFKDNDTSDSSNLNNVSSEVFNFTEMVNRFSNPDRKTPDMKFIDPEFGLYSKDEIQQIADTTGADLLFSFDYFASVDGIYSPNFIVDLSDTFMVDDFAYYYPRRAKEVVNILSCWNFYDLKKQELAFSYRKTDTIKWTASAYNLKEAIRTLPPRKDAVLNAADIAGSRFAEFLVPHWIEVERMYYKSGHVELKKTEELIQENRWLDAAEIWKKNTTNKNKSIAAKSMFNMALACEMNSDIDAAIDWAVKSFYVFGAKNQFHASNCQNYIQILARRKIDIQRIESLSGKNNSD